MQQGVAPTHFPQIPAGVQPIIINTRPNEVKVNKKSARALGVATIIIGVASIGLGIAVLLNGREKKEFEDYAWSGIVGIVVGVWVIITGIIGLKSSAVPKKASYNCISMSFNIVVCVLSLIAAIIFGHTSNKLSDCEYEFYGYGPYLTFLCEDRDAAKGYAITLTVLHGTMFFVALATIILCLAAGGTSSCCFQTTRVIYQQQPYVQSGQVFVTPSSNGLPYLDNPISSYSNESDGAQRTYASTNLAYSTDQPPEYEEKEHSHR